MRIALIAPPWVPVPPPLYGGTETVVDRLARGFHTAGHDVLLCTTGDSTCPVPRHHVLESTEQARMGAVVPELRHVIHAYQAAQDCDIVHDHTMVGPVYAQRFPELTTVTTNHGPFNDELLDIYRAVAPWVSIIAISRSQASHAVGVPIAGVIHHGIDVDELPFGEHPGEYFLFLGRMAPDKGARRAALVARQAGVPLRIAAKMREPLEFEYYEEQVKPLLGGDIEYVGEVGGDQKLELLARARGLLNPIRWVEPFGLVMIEALGCGTPVLTFRQGAAPEIVDDGVTGFLCEDRDEMAEAIHRVDQLDRRACRTAVEDRFSTERMVGDHLALFESLLSRRSSSATEPPAPRPTAAGVAR
ncbi:MAG: glycosyltransferase family 4 protein [Actinomycetota bacterium]|jgi:glycosyltransferase involved in cell wall biosynthesis|nr:glycosyltransferase family 4 protein [Actinomycetota bacterium]